MRYVLKFVPPLTLFQAEAAAEEEGKKKQKKKKKKAKEDADDNDNEDDNNEAEAEEDGGEDKEVRFQIESRILMEFSNISDLNHFSSLTYQ